jgi:ABC-2 type transport system ATP-binding protein
VEFTVPDRARVADAELAVIALSDEQPTIDVTTGQVSVRVGHRGSQALIQIVRNLDETGIETQGLALRRPSLDDVFLAITGHAAESDELQPSTPGRGERPQPVATTEDQHR